MKGAGTPGSNETPDERRARQATRKEALQDRRKKALELRKAGATYDDIAAHLKVSRTQARKDVSQALNGITLEPATEVLTLELERLDRLFLEAFTNVTKQSLAEDTRMRAVDRALRIMDRRAKYLGLDQAPTADDSEQVKMALQGFLKNLQDDEDTDTEGQDAPL